jgi:hypothetical protein
VKTKLLKMLIPGLSLLMLGCAHTPTPPAAKVNGTTYEERFDPWRASNYALGPASRGDRDAQITFFLAAYVRMSQPYTGGEDLEQMDDNVKQLLATLGDDAFSHALQQQRPEVRSAVRSWQEMMRSFALRDGRFSRYI